MARSGVGRKTRVDHVGEKFGRLVVVAFHHRGSRRESFWLCECACGQRTVAAWGNLRSGDIKSCGCLHDEVAGDARRTHGKSKTRTYLIWKTMVKRCSNRNDQKWDRYGGRGIKVCDSWRSSFENFLADMGEAPTGKSIDRYPDNDGHYEPGNCRWATAKQQSRNTSKNLVIEVDGERKPLCDWAVNSPVTAQTISYRLKRGMSPSDAVNQPSRTFRSPTGRSKQSEVVDA
jgi:hypothetical protein